MEKKKKAATVTFSHLKFHCIGVDVDSYGPEAFQSDDEVTSGVVPKESRGQHY